jgi:small-conductance mechanosensitive channel
MPLPWRLLIAAAALLALALTRRALRARQLPPPPWRLPAVALLLQVLWLPEPARAGLSVAQGLASGYGLLVLLSWALLQLPPCLGLGRAVPQILRDLLSLAVGALFTVIQLQQARVNLVGLITTSAVLTAVIGLAAQETLKDLFGGLSMQIGAPFRVGDWVDLGEQRGQVQAITLMNTQLQTLDGAAVVVPNSQAAAAIALRYRPGQPVGHRFSVGLDYSHPPAQALRLLQEVLERHPAVLADPPPRVWISRFADSAVEYELQLFQQEVGEGPQFRLRGELLEQLWYALNREDRRIPFPVLELRRHHHAPQTPEELELEQPQRRAELLKANPLFARLSTQQLATLAPLTRCLRFGPGETVVREGEPGDCLFQVVEGALEVSKRGPDGDGELTVAQLERHAVFGEMTLFTDAPRQATVRSLGETVLLEVERADLLPLLEGNPSLLEDLSQLIAARQSQLEALHDAAASGPGGSLLERMRLLFAGLGVGLA